MPEDKGIFKCLKCDYVTVFKTEFVSHYEKVHFHTRNYTLKKQKRQERALNRENRILDHKLKKVFLPEVSSLKLGDKVVYKRHKNND